MNQTIAAIVLALHLLLPSVANAQATVKSPLSYSLQEYGFILAISMMGGLVRWLHGLRQGKVMSLGGLIGELATSAFVGFLTFWACEAMSISPLITACATGIAGHIGAKTLEWAEIAGRKMLEKRLGVKFEESAAAPLEKA